MEISEVKIFPFEPGDLQKNLKAYAEITLHDSLTIKGIKIFEKENGGIFITFPAIQGKGKGDFWTSIYHPFKGKRMTRDAVSSLIETAKTRYQTNLPGLAVKLGVCSDQFRTDAEENKKFLSFKNFLYKTVKITAH